MIELKISLGKNATPQIIIEKNGVERSFDEMDAADRYKVIQHLENLRDELMRRHKELW